MYDNLARGSIITGSENARVLYWFMKMHDMIPRSIVEKAKQDRRESEDLFDCVTKMEKEDKAPTYIQYI